MKKISLILLAVVVGATTLLAQTQTITVNANVTPVKRLYKWGTTFCSGTTYSQPAGSIYDVGFESNVFAGCHNEESFIAKAKFNHPNFPNSQITSITIRYDAKLDISQNVSFGNLQIHVPSQSCANSTSSATVFNCVNMLNGGAYTMLGTNVSVNSSWAAKTITITPSTNPNLNVFNSSSTFFHVGFDAWAGVMNVRNIRADITYNCPTPAAPGSFSATANGTSQIALNWASVSNATQYQVYACNGGLVTTTSATSYNINGLAPGSTRSYRVRAVNSCGNGSFAACQTATTTLQTPVMTGNTTTANSVTVDWNPVPGATSYRVETCSGSFVANVNTPATAYVHTGRNGGTTYAYRVRASNGNANSSFSSCRNYYTAFAKPSNFRITGGSVATIDLAWNTVPGAQEYRIWRYIFASSSYSLVAALPVGTSSYTVTGLNPGTYYSYAISVSGSGNYAGSGRTNRVGITTASFPAPVLTVNNAVVSWTAVSGACSYQVYTCSGTLLTTTNQTSASFSFWDWVETGLDVKVRAVHCNGTTLSSFSNCEEVFEGPVEHAPIFFRKDVSESAKTDQPAVLVAPNPSAGRFNLSVNRAVASMEIVDLTGKTVWSEQQPMSQQVDLQHLPSGIYLLRVFEGETITTQKLIKQ
mgnify:CR=1 FL=1